MTPGAAIMGVKGGWHGAATDRIFPPGRNDLLSTLSYSLADRRSLSGWSRMNGLTWSELLANVAIVAMFVSVWIHTHVWIDRLGAAARNGASVC